MVNIKKIGRKLIVFLLYLFRIFPIKNNKILFCSFMGKGYSDNPKYIYKELQKRDLNLDFVWAVEKGESVESFPSDIRVVRLRSLQFFYELVTAKVWIDNSRKPSYVRKRKKQCYIQTWHGSIPIKRVEKDAEDSLDDEYIRCAKNDAKMTDLMLSNSKFCTDMYRRAFWYDGLVLVTGSPRNDILVKCTEKDKKAIRKRLNIGEHFNVVLYAPTFRANGSTQAYNMDYQMLRDTLHERFGGEWIVLIKLHPLIAGKKSILIKDDFVVNVSLYDDIYELMCISEMLVTDYSSTMFEMMITDKKVLLFASDRKDYIQDRGFYFDYFRLPFPKAESNDELRKNIKTFDETMYFKKIDILRRELGLQENGDASKKVCDYIIKVLDI